MEEKQSMKTHSLLLEERKFGRVTGVRDIHSFNEHEIIVLSEAGKILIKGDQLHVKSLNLEKGEAEIEGKINNFSYLTSAAKKKEESVWKRMFR